MAGAMARRRSSPWLLTLALLTLPALALTPPMGGAVAFPRGAPLHLPFASGVRVRLLSGYSPSGGSSLHEGTNRAGFANDYYALDLVVDGRSDSGLGEPILAPLRGTVVRAGWSSAGWANYGQRVILRHDLGDGHTYHTIYCHLNAVDAREGATVEAGQRIGTLGRSCQGALSCGSFSTPHLHWAVHRDSSVGGSGTGGSYGGVAVVPEPLSGAEDLRMGAVITSALGAATPRCGDGVCAAGESCPADCPTCALIPRAGRVVEESDRCVERFGNAMYWYAASAGSGGALLWTHATAATAADNAMRWTLRIEQAGDYELSAFTAAGYAASRRAVYQVTHAGRTDRVTVDQSAENGWSRLGRFTFVAGEGQSVRLDDNTGEAFADRVRLAFDAIRVAPAAAVMDAGAAPDVPRADVARVDRTPPNDRPTLVDLPTPVDRGVALDAAVATDRPDVSDVGFARDDRALPTDLGAARDAGATPVDVAAPDDAGDPWATPDGSVQGGCACATRRRVTAPRGLPLLALLALLRRRRRR